MKLKLAFFISILFLCFAATAQNIMNNPGSNHGNKFEQLGTILPTGNEYRTASGAPGSKYWQQRADYDITCTLDEIEKRLDGSEKITYFNNSPDVLTYIWLQLDENEHSKVNNSGFDGAGRPVTSYDEKSIDRLMSKTDKYGVKLKKVTDALGKNLQYTVNKTMMRIELPTPLKPGMQFKCNIDWYYYLTEKNVIGGRGGYEYFPDVDDNIFTIAQWFPRLCVYSDFQGWQNHQFTGRGEFALVFGNYKVAITTNADHTVLATGECQNYAQVLSPTELKRWNTAQTSTDVVEIVTLADILAKEGKKSTNTKTWIYKADMVRDFALGVSRKFAWDAMPIKVEGKKVMCMSGYPKESFNLYRRFSTKAVAHTIKTYSKFTIPYPYPVAQSLEASNGMEYPMICFNYGRCEKDGTYSEGIKQGMLGVVIHEVGHNFFPMIINSDERQWSWMDEGLNTFSQYLTEELWDNKYPSGRGPASGITDYMAVSKDQLEPIMTNSENIANFGANAYAKPCAGLNILRETIMGRKLFDYSFKEYARRWAFKHPTPADLFRTMEDASAVDLDWFWRGWFYSTDACDISIDTVKWSVMNSDIPTPRTSGGTEISSPLTKSMAFGKPDDISKIRNREDKSIVFATDADPSLRDFYWHYARGTAKLDSNVSKITTAKNTQDVLPEEQRQALGKNFFIYEVTLSNKGGLVMPVILEFTYEDGTKEVEYTDAQIWRKNENKCSKSFYKSKKVVAIKLDPYAETADINTKNNSWPLVTEPSKFQIYKSRAGGRGGASGNANPMQKALEKY